MLSSFLPASAVGVVQAIWLTYAAGEPVTSEQRALIDGIVDHLVALIIERRPKYGANVRPHERTLMLRVEWEILALLTDKLGYYELTADVRKNATPGWEPRRTPYATFRWMVWMGEPSDKVVYVENYVACRAGMGQSGFTCKIPDPCPAGRVNAALEGQAAGKRDGETYEQQIKKGELS